MILSKLISLTILAIVVFTCPVTTYAEDASDPRSYEYQFIYCDTRDDIKALHDCTCYATKAADYLVENPKAHIQEVSKNALDACFDVNGMEEWEYQQCLNRKGLMRYSFEQKDNVCQCVTDKLMTKFSEDTTHFNRKAPNFRRNFYTRCLHEVGLK